MLQQCLYQNSRYTEEPGATATALCRTRSPGHVLVAEPGCDQLSAPPTHASPLKGLVFPYSCCSSHVDSASHPATTHWSQRHRIRSRCPATVLPVRSAMPLPASAESWGPHRPQGVGQHPFLLPRPRFRAPPEVVSASLRSSPV